MLARHKGIKSIKSRIAYRNLTLKALKVEEDK